MAPKIKTIGKIVARASTDPPTAFLAGYSVEWHDGLTFRNASDTEALCIYVAGKDYHSSGLHLSRSAATQLAVDLANEAAMGGGSVAVMNHSGGTENLWQRLSDSDALTLADRIRRALV